MNWRFLPVVRSVRRTLQSWSFARLAANRDIAADPLVELWLSLDPTPPRPSVFAAARAIYADRFIAQVIGYRAELGPPALNYLRENLVGACRRAAWEDE